MKKIIKGKKYDTEKAEYIDCYQYSNPRDLNYLREELYRKKTGEFFLHGEGGQLSKYSKPVGNNEWSGGEEIIPLDLIDAENWVEENCDEDKYEELFSVVDDGEKVRMVLKLNKPYRKMLEEQALEHKCNQSEWVEYLLKKENR